MSYQAPPVTERSQEADLIESFKRLAGRPLTRVVYCLLDDASIDLVHAQAQVDEVDLAVLLVFDGLTVRIDWSHQGWTDGLAVQFDCSVPSGWVSVEMQSTANWAPFLSREPGHVDIFWHFSAEDSPESVFAVRLTSPEGKSYLVALGEFEGNISRYTPESILVNFAPNANHSYLMHHVSGITSISMTAGGDA